MLLAEVVSKQSKKSETEAAKLQQQLLRGTNNLTNFARSGGHVISTQLPYLSSLSDVGKSIHKADFTTKTETQEPEVESEVIRPVAAEHQSKGEGTAIEKQNLSAKGVKKAPAKEDSADKTKGPEGEKAPAASDKTTLTIEKVVTKGEKSPRTPEEDPAFQSVVENAKKVAKQQRQHEPAKKKAAQAQAAAVGPPNEVESQAKAAQVEKMDAQEPGHFDRAAFKAALVEKIASVAPTNLEEADDFKKNNKASSIKDSITSSVKQGKESAKGAIRKTTAQPPDPSSIKAKEHTDLPAQQVGPSPQDIGAQQAAPKPKTDSEISLQEGSQSIETQMTEAEISEEQLAKSNESQFQDAVKAKKDAQQHSNDAPAVYRQEEQAILASSQEQSSALAQVQIQSMHQVRQGQFNKVRASQTTAKSVDEQKRAEVSTKIEAIYSSTKQKVEARLSRLDEEVNSVFDSGLEQATREFEDYVARQMSDYKKKRYSGRIRGKIRWVKDKLAGMPDEVNKFYKEGRQKYVEKMNAVIDSVATIVETGLNEAKEMISAGRQEVKTYVKSLPKALRNVGKEAAENIESRFDELNQSLDEKNNQLVDSLSQKYVENMNKVDERINEMKAENKGLVDKAKDAIVGAIKTILKLKDMLLGVLAKVANVVSKIIKDPIGFVGNLVKGVKAGLNNFIGKIGEYLQQGLFEWLFGELSQAGIKMPESLDFKGVLSLVMQALGLTYPAIRARAVKIVGERVVKGLEQASEIFMTLVSEGPSGLWKYIQEKIGDLKETVIEGIKSFLKEKIITAGITWIISLLNPASAFIKAAKAIYDIVMFFVTRGSQIMSLVDAIIDSMAAIADGGIGVAAAAVEKALGRTVPVLIGLLASFIGFGGISEKIRGIIGKVQAPVTKAVDWVIEKAVSLTKSAGKLLGIGNVDGEKKIAESKPDERTNEQKQADIDHALAEGEKLLSDDSVSADKLEELLPNIKASYRLKSLEAVVDEATDEGQIMHIHAEVNPKKDSKKVKKKVGDQGLPFSMPLSMAGAGHILTVKEEAGHLIVSLASREQKLRDGFAQVDRILKHWEKYIDEEIANPAIKEEFTILIKPIIEEKKTSSLESFVARLEGMKSHDFEKLKPEIHTIIKTLASEISEWATSQGIAVKDFTDDAVKAEIDRKADEDAEKVWNNTRRITQEQLERFAGEIQALDPEAKLKYRGSLAKMRKGIHQEFREWDSSDFDIDFFIESDRLYLEAGGRPEKDGGKIQDAREHIGLANIYEAMQTAYDSMKGVRKGSFTMWLRTVSNVQELVRKSREPAYAGERHGEIKPPPK